MTTKNSASILAAAALAMVSGAALAEESEAPADSRVPVELAVAGGTNVFGSEAVSESTLRATAGREDTTQVSQAELAAGVSNNSVGDNVTTGNAQIDGNAFQNMSGLSILNVNTGNNVAMNAAMNVNISISPAP